MSTEEEFDDEFLGILKTMTTEKQREIRFITAERSGAKLWKLKEKILFGDLPNDWDKLKKALGEKDTLAVFDVGSEDPGIGPFLLAWTSKLYTVSSTYRCFERAVAKLGGKVPMCLSTNNLAAVELGTIFNIIGDGDTSREVINLDKYM